MNGGLITEGTPVKTATGNHVVGFSVSTPKLADASVLTPGDTVSVTTMVFAEPAVTP